MAGRLRLPEHARTPREDDAALMLPPIAAAARETRARRSRRAFARVFAALTVAGILILTLYPTSHQLPPEGFGCLLCDPRVTADAVANLLLFVPLGLAMAMLGWPVWRALIAAAVLTTGIETTQFFVLPGRDANVLDAIFNLAGAGAGLLLAGGLAAAAVLPAARAARLSVAAAVGVVAVMAATAALFSPAPPATGFQQIRWEESPGGLQPYRGRVQRAFLGSLELPRQRLTEAGPVRARLRGGEQLSIIAVAGPRPDDLSHLFSLHEVRNSEVFLVAIRGDDLVLRYRTRARALRLDQPSHSITGVLSAVSAGDPLRISIWRAGSGFCASVNDQRRCDFGATVGRGWSFLLFGESIPVWLQRSLDVGWLIALALPLGLLVRIRPPSGVAMVILITGGVLVRSFGLPPPSLLEWLSLLVGILLGMALCRLLRRWIGDPIGSAAVERFGGARAST